MINSNRPATVLTIAGSDSGGGAGIQADIKSISANGCFALSVITAITAQNTFAVTDIHKIPLTTIRSQLDAVFADLPIDAIKIGMLADKATILTIVEVLQNQAKLAPIILDPVMISKAGAPLLEAEAIASLKTDLLPLATLITPNLPEAQVLAGLDGEENGKTLAESIDSNAHVLIKGGHRQGEDVVDYLRLNDGQVFTYQHRKITSKNTHGTGCSLSSAIAAQVALGKSIPDAVEAAGDYIFYAINKAKNWQLGQGHGPIAHFDYL